MRTVGLIVRVDLTIVVDEVEAVDIVNETVAIIIDTFLTIEFLRVDEEIVLEVWMSDIDTTVGDSDDDVRLTRFFSQTLKRPMSAPATLRGEAAGIVVVPLVAEHRVIEGAAGASLLRGSIVS